MVRLRQLLHEVGQGLLVIPLVFVVGAVALSQVMVRVDSRLEDSGLPEGFETSVDAAQAILAAIAGGLLTSVTLLLSLVLVAVQLAASQFSPRTLRDWTGDGTQQVAIGLVMGTSVYCLLVLRETRALGDDFQVIPHLSVLLAVALGVASLVAVLLSVDKLTNSLRIGSVTKSITDETVALIQLAEKVRLSAPESSAARSEKPTGAVAVPSDRSGWIQQIDEQEILDALPDGATAWMATSLGSYAFAEAPLLWVWPDTVDDGTARRLRSAVALGDQRTMQQDVGYGILQLVDIAVRALSPGINDPNTAGDVIVSLGTILLEVWSGDEQQPVRSGDGKTLIRQTVGHREFLESAFGPLRRYGAGDPSVVATMIRTLSTVRNETVRRELPGPIEPIDDTIEAIHQEFLARDPSPLDRRAIDRLLDDCSRGFDTGRLG